MTDHPVHCWHNTEIIDSQPSQMQQCCCHGGEWRNVPLAALVDHRAEHGRFLVFGNSLPYYGVDVLTERAPEPRGEFIGE